MWLKITADTLNVIATLAIAFVVLSVHNKLRDQTKIDPVVVQQLDQEEIIVVVAIVLLGVGYAMTTIDNIQNVYRDQRLAQIHEKLATGQVSPDELQRFVSKTKIH